MLPAAGNLNATLPYGNPSGRPPEESIPNVFAPQYERPASPTPLEGQSLAKKDSCDALKARKSQLHSESSTLGKATYASVVDKDSSHSNTAKSGSKFVEEEVEVLAEDVIIDKSEPIPSIRFSNRVHERIDRNMRNAIIVRLLGRSIGYATLLNKMRAMWNPEGDIQLIDIENNYFIVRFSHAGDYTKVVKIDYNTQGGGRGKFARLAVLVDLNKPLLARIHIDGNIQRIEYEGLHHICYNCGTYGHSKEQCDGLRSQMEATGDSNSAGPHTSHSEGHDTKEVESFGPSMVAETRRRRPAGRIAATDNTRSLVGSSRFASLEILEEGTVVTGMSKEHSVTSEVDLGSTKKHLDVVEVGNGVTKNAAYMASNPDKRAKAGAVQTRTAMVVPTVAGQSATAVEHVTGGLKGSHTAVKIMEPAVKGQSGQVGVRSSGFKGRAAKASVSRGVRGRRASEPRVFDQPTLTTVGQSSAGLKGNMIEGFHPPVLISHSSDEETLYEMSNEEAMIEAEEGERLLTQ
ncbi:hypothetical protein GQ457_11G023650 [Hibiscus cannabinus]